MKKAIKCIIFLFIFIVLFCLTFKVLWPTKNAIAYFYKEPKNSIDVAYLGSSTAYAHFNTTLAYNLHGFATGMDSTDNQPFPTIKYLIKDIEKYQNPKVYIIDLLKSQEEIEKIKLEAIRYTLDAMRFSQNRIDAIDKMLQYKDVNKNEYINYYFSFFMYHNLWKHLNVTFFTGNRTLYKGHLLVNFTVKALPLQEYDWDYTRMELPEENKEILTDLMNYIKEENLNVIFIIPPRVFSNPSETLQKLNSVIDMVKEEGFKVINFNTLDDLKFDVKTEFYNDGHLNAYGATKFTIYFSQYLKENYELQDHRQDTKYESWAKEYERYKADFKQLTGKEFEKLL